MIDESILRGIGLIIVAAAIFTILASRLNVPSIVSYLVAGLVLGPITGLLAVSDVINLISHVGIALLLFIVGLELSLDKVRDVGRVAIVAGLGQVVFTAAGGFVLAMLLGFGAVEAIFLAVALTFSSTVVVVKLLDQKGELDSLYGRIAVGIFLVQDLVVIFALTFLAALGAGSEEFDLAELAVNLGLAFGGTALLLAVALLASRYLLPRPFAWSARSPETLFIWSLCWCFLFVLASEAMNLSLEIGSFLAGISLAQLPYNEDLRRRVHPLMNFFIAIFFVSLGLQMELGAALDHIGSAAALSLFVLIGNPLIFMFIIARQGYSEKTSFFTSVTVAQISEFSFIFATMGITTGLIGEHILSIVAVVGLVTIAISSYMILYSEAIYRFMHRAGLLRIFGASTQPEPELEEGLSDHVIVVGMNSLGRELVKKLSGRGELVLAIDTDVSKLEGLPCQTMLGSVDYLSVLDDAGLVRAKLVISALQIEDTNKMLAYRSRAHGVPVSIHAFDRSVHAELHEIGVDYLITPKETGVSVQIDELRRLGVIEP
ncbi:MAG: cation:proton antiporter [Bradymonadaceae bacterium]|nr:cation:proton antiporter [Lujinxingiaceae bacterium]